MEGSWNFNVPVVFADRFFIPEKSPTETWSLFSLCSSRVLRDALRGDFLNQGVSAGRIKGRIEAATSSGSVSMTQVPNSLSKGPVSLV
jgi:hypothetical protein